MKTIILEQPGQLRLAETTVPTAPGPGEALVRIRRVGICGTDLHAYKGEQPFFSYPRILGHELGVEVVALGDGPRPDGVTTGTQCCLNPYLNCGHCGACRRGTTNCCSSLKVLGVHTDGGMRELLLVPIANLLPAPALSLEEMALVEMLCIGAHAVRRTKPLPGEDVLVIGAGPIGLSTLQFAKLTGANVIGMEVSDNRMAFAQQHLGIEQWIDGRGDVIAQLQALLGGELPLRVLDATGNAGSMMRAFNYTTQGGSLTFVGLFQGDVTFHDPEFHRRELTLLASRNATAEDFRYVLDRLSDGTVNVMPWITHRTTPEAIAADFPTWYDPQQGVVKAMLEID